MVRAALDIFNHPFADVWREQSNEFLHVTTQHGVLSETDPGSTDRKQACRVDPDKIVPVTAFVSHG